MNNYKGKDAMETRATKGWALPGAALPKAAAMPLSQKRGGRRFTLIELMVVVAIIAILASLLFPALASVKAAANGLKCLSNLRQCGVVFNMYASDWRGWTPTISTWQMRLANYAPGDSIYKLAWPDGESPWRYPSEAQWRASIFGCPPYKRDTYNYLCSSGYGMNYDIPPGLVGFSNYPYVYYRLYNAYPRQALIADASNFHLSWSGTPTFDNRHSGKCNVLFARDSHAESIPNKLSTPYNQWIGQLYYGIGNPAGP